MVVLSNEGMCIFLHLKVDFLIVGDAQGSGLFAERYFYHFSRAADSLSLHLQRSMSGGSLGQRETRAELRERRGRIERFIK